MCQSSEDMYVASLRLVRLVLPLVLSVKSFVDSGNNGLDGVRHPAVIPSIIIERQLGQTLGYPQGCTPECEGLCHLHNLQGRVLVLRSCWIWRRHCEARGRM